MEENRNLMEPAQEPVEETVAEAAESGAKEGVDALRAELEAALEEKFRQMLEEAARLSGMTAEERAEYDAARREDDLAEREKRIARRELRADALEELEKRGLPKALADAVGYDSREGMIASIDAVEKAFRQAVQAAVDERLRGVSPAAGASAQGGGDEMDDETYYRMAGMGR